MLETEAGASIGRLWKQNIYEEGDVGVDQMDQGDVVELDIVKAEWMECGDRFHVGLGTRWKHGIPMN